MYGKFKVGHAFRKIGVRRAPWDPWLVNDVAGYLKPGDTIVVEDTEHLAWDWTDNPFVKITKPVVGYLNVRTWYDSFTDDERGEYGGPDIE